MGAVFVDTVVICVYHPPTSAVWMAHCAQAAFVVPE